MKNFEEFRTERRSKIITMDTILRNNEDFKENEIDVILRGFIVLIYAFWEGNYKQIQENFYEIIKNEKIKNLPFTIKNKVLLELSGDHKFVNSKVKEISDYRKFTEVTSIMKESEEKRAFEFEKRIDHHFKEFSNNPKIHNLENLLAKYQMNLDKIIKKLIEINALPEDFSNRLDFIIHSRNSIAHGVENLEDTQGYKDCIINQFLVENNSPNREIGIIDVSDFLRDLTFYIDVLYKEIYTRFENKYMHEE